MSEFLLLRMRAMALQMQALDILKKCNHHTRALNEGEKAKSENTLP